MKNCDKCQIDQIKDLDDGYHITFALVAFISKIILL